MIETNNGLLVNLCKTNTEVNIKLIRHNMIICEPKHDIGIE